MKVVHISEANGKLSDWELFWECYPRHGNKLDARKAWSQVEKHRPPIEAIIAVINRKISSGKWNDPQFVPLPATFLRKGGFLDED